MATLIEVGSHDINKEGFWGCTTPLSRAAYGGYEHVVKIQPGRGKVNPEMLGNDGQTPPSYAAQGKHGGVVKVLLGLEEVIPHKPNKWGRTQLSGVHERGYEGAAKILHTREEADPDMPDSYGETQLPYVAQNRCLRTCTSSAATVLPSGSNPSTI